MSEQATEGVPNGAMAVSSSAEALQPTAAEPPSGGPDPEVKDIQMTDATPDQVDVRLLCSSIGCRFTLPGGLDQMLLIFTAQSRTDWHHRPQLPRRKRLQLQHSRHQRPRSARHLSLQRKLPQRRALLRSRRARQARRRCEED
jgi:hypothetical protein